MVAIAIENTPEVRERLARIIAETCRCDAEPLLEGMPFASVIEQFDSLAMLEILLAIETELGVDSESLMRRADSETVNLEETFPEDLSSLIQLMKVVLDNNPGAQSAVLQKPEQAKAKTVMEASAQ
ncbi:acyl carrier protein [Kerstersia sp.]|uniref:acyl carrier protein n=1 Tax=Kerstersia sp. TaxID=1930783 RepID=UPI003F8F3943